VQILVNGLLLGGLYGIVTVGFSLVWGVTSVVNIAHSSFITLGAYAAYVLYSQFGLGPFAALPFVMIFLYLVGYVIQRQVINRVIRYGLVMTLIVAFGIDLMLTNAIQVIFTADYQKVTYDIGGLTLGTVQIPYLRLAIFVMALVLTALLALFLSHTRPGRAIRATALNQEAAQMMGVSIDKVYANTFAVAASIAGGAGCLMATLYSFNPEIGRGFLTKVFVITVLGGLGSLPGAIIGGLLIGLVEAFTTVYVGAGYTELMAFGVLVTILALRPQGLLGKRFYGGAKA
jgi:branched-chain amino acid transport system permease protein